MFWILKYFDNFKNFTSHSMSMLSSTRKLGSKGSTLSKSNLDMMKNSSHRDEYPAMQSNGPLPQVSLTEWEDLAEHVKRVKPFGARKFREHTGWLWLHRPEFSGVGYDGASAPEPLTHIFNCYVCNYFLLRLRGPRQHSHSTF